MDSVVKSFIEYIISTRSVQRRKDILIRDVVEHFDLTRSSTVYYCSNFAVRFSYSKLRSFSNTVLSLSKLMNFDSIPFFVVVVHGEGDNELFLANSTFLKKISHSSKELTIRNIKGSFNGCDIAKEYDGITNCAENIEALYAYHREASWSDNLERLVEATNGIVGHKTRFNCGERELNGIYDSLDRAIRFVTSANYVELKQDLDNRVERKMDAIIAASHIENVNIRGRLIEFLITNDDDERTLAAADIESEYSRLPLYKTNNELGDYKRLFDREQTYTDVKTKILYLGSNPKAYNIDKFLQCISEPNTIFLLYFIGIDKNGIFNTILTSVYHTALIDATVVQQHWAGRNMRGTTQFIGSELSKMLQSKTFCNTFDEDKFREFIEKLVNL